VVVDGGGDEAASCFASFIIFNTLCNTSCSSNELQSRVRNSDIIIVTHIKSSIARPSINEKSTVLNTFGLGSSDAETPPSALSVDDDDEDGGAASFELAAVFGAVVDSAAFAGAGAAGTLAYV